jgi:hypothetical protein
VTGPHIGQSLNFSTSSRACSRKSGAAVMTPTAFAQSNPRNKSDGC